MKISADGSKLLYYQQQQISNIWLANIDGSGAHALTFDERRLGAPALSPDGSAVAFEQWGLDPVKVERSICAVNTDGTGRREITAGRGIAQVPRWSPGGKWIAFLTRGRNQPADSNHVAIIEAANPGLPHELVQGNGVFWMSPLELAVIRRKAGRFETAIVPIDGGQPRTLGVDSTVLIPVVRGGYVLSITQRAGGLVRIVPIKDGGPDWGRTQIVGSDPLTGVSISDDGSFGLVHTVRNQLVKLMLPSGRKYTLPNGFPGFDLESSFSVSHDGRKFIYNDIKMKGNLVMIENMR